MKQWNSCITYSSVICKINIISQTDEKHMDLLYYQVEALIILTSASDVTVQEPIKSA
jgi:hypothetical protein